MAINGSNKKHLMKMQKIIMFNIDKNVGKLALSGFIR